MKIYKHKILQRCQGFMDFLTLSHGPPRSPGTQAKNTCPNWLWQPKPSELARGSHSSTVGILSSVPLLTDLSLPPHKLGDELVWPSLFPKKELKSSDAVTYHLCQDRIFSDQTLPSRSGTCSTEHLSCNKMSGGWMIIFAIMENTAQTGLNNKGNLLDCDNKKV